MNKDHGAGMALTNLKLIKSEDKDTMTLQGNVREFVNQLNNVILGGSILQSVSIGTATTDVPHQLGRSFQGWHLVDIQGDARVWRDTTATSDTTKFLPLKASAAVTVNLWVF
jgi:hypothetical protein